jgi:hypothetical protein
MDFSFKRRTRGGDRRCPFVFRDETAVQSSR